MNKDAILKKLEALSGNIGVTILEGTGDELHFGGDLPIEAASVIKLPIMGTAFKAAAEGRLNLDDVVETDSREMMPGCGVITRLHAGLKLTIRDLIVLMIIVSDNTATNMMIDILGIEAVNRFIDSEGLKNTRLRRKMFDAESAARGIINTVSSDDMAVLLDKICKGKLVSAEASAEMLSILDEQQLNGKIPFYLSHNDDPDLDIDSAHKTGEDDGITHDVGILFTEPPMVFCFLSEHTHVPETVQAIQTLARDLVYPDTGC
ncbi:MAG: serine hydrolase [Clostridia bacterium]|nr:serine hydrolase [Clostridia bacterium]